LGLYGLPMDGEQDPPAVQLLAVAQGLRRHLEHYRRQGVDRIGAPSVERELSTPDPATALPRGLTLPQIRDELGECVRCKLHETRQHIVFGAGDGRAPLMFIGEGPGADEDRTGEPFVGRAGELLDKMIVAMGWRRDDVYIANVIKCRPPGNRTPEADEVSACQPFLLAQIAAVAPRIIVALGRPAANTLLGNDAPISALRGKFFDCRGAQLMPTFHPAFLLRQPERKRDAWSDLQQVMVELQRLGISPPPRTTG
jgi:uracil-DNA glycosylase